MLLLGQAKKDTAELQEKSKEMKAAVIKAEEDAKVAEATRDKTVVLIGNLVHDSVPVSKDEVFASSRTLQRPSQPWGDISEHIILWFGQRHNRILGNQSNLHQLSHVVLHAKSAG
jgi:seryl-tRNA synthetase